MNFVYVRNSIVLMFIGFCLSSHLLAYEEDWVTLTKIECELPKEAIILVSRVLVDTSFRVTDISGRTLQKANVITGDGSVIDLSKFDNHISNSLQASSSLGSNSAKGIDFRIACIDHAMLPSVRSLNEAIALSDMQGEIGIPSGLLELKYWRLRQKLEKMLTLERHDQLADEVSQILLEASLNKDITEEIELVALWAQARSYYAKYDFENTLKSYKEVWARLDSAQGLQPVWSSYRAEMEGEYGNSMLQIGYQRQDDGLKEEGKKLIDDALSYFATIGDLKSAAQVQSTLASYYWLKSDYGEAERQLIESIEKHEKVGVSRELGDSLNNISILYKWLGKTDAAISAINRALEIEDRYPTNSGRASLVLNLARIYQSIGKYDIASRQAKEAIVSYKDVGNKVGEALANLALGRAYREMGRVSEAIVAHQKGLEYFLPDPGQQITRVVEVTMARTELIKDYLANGEYKKALKMAEANERLLNKKGKSQSSQPTKFSRDQITNLLIQLEIALVSNDEEKFREVDELLISVFRDTDSDTAYPIEKLEFERIRLEQSLTGEDQNTIKESAQTAASLVRQVRQQLDTRELGPAWSAKASAVLDLYVSAMVKVAPYEGGDQSWLSLFDFIERQQAVSLRKNRRNSYLVADEEDSVLANSALQKASRQEHSATRATTQEAIDRALIRAAEARESYRAHASKTEVSGKKDELTYLGISDIQAQMKEQELVARFYIRDRVSLVYFITKKNWYAEQLPEKTKLEEISTLLLEQLSSQSLQMVTTSQRAKALFGFDKIVTDGFQKLVVVPDGPLLAFPLGVINIASESFGYEPLESQVQVVNVYSLSDYFGQLDFKPSNDFVNDIAIFADPVFDGIELLKFGNQVASIENYRSWSNSLARLPWTGKEAESISTIFSSKKISQALRSEATSEALMSTDMRNSKVLHVASHGYFSEITPDVVGIATAVKDGDSSSGFLTLTQMLSKSFPSNLVVISGCETSLGEELVSEGLNGLSRGILAQGAGSVIGTLWPIPDRPTAKFMTAFYSFLKEYDGDTSRALTAAKRKFLKSGRYKHPYFWSGFILTSANRVYETNVFR